MLHGAARMLTKRCRHALAALPCWLLLLLLLAAA
jgi:hypothetical protein